VRQADWQPLFPPQLLTHSLFDSVQMKYGMVCEYSVALGVAPLLQTQLNERVGWTCVRGVHRPEFHAETNVYLQRHKCSVAGIRSSLVSGGR
jgi:hypothetical protein